MKWTKAELLKNHHDSKKFDCYDKMEIAFVDLLLKENAELKSRLKGVKETIMKHHPNGTLESPRFQFAKMLYDIANKGIVQ